MRSRFRSEPVLKTDPEYPELMRRIRAEKREGAEILEVKVRLYCTLRTKKQRSNPLLFDNWAELSFKNRWGKEMNLKVQIPDKASFDELGRMLRPLKKRS